MPAPPSVIGAVMPMVAPLVVGVTVAIDGVLATVRGVTSFGTEAAPTPAAFLAATVHEYSMPFTRLATEALVDVADAFLFTMLAPAVQVTTYPLIGLPPLNTGGVQVIVPFLAAAVMVCDMGASGMVRGVTFFAADEGPVPAPFDAVTEHEYSTPLTNELTVCGLTALRTVTGVSPSVHEAV